MITSCCSVGGQSMSHGSWGKMKGGTGTPVSSEAPRLPLSGTFTLTHVIRHILLFYLIQTHTPSLSLQHSLFLSFCLTFCLVSLLLLSNQEMPSHFKRSTFPLITASVSATVAVLFLIGGLPAACMFLLQLIIIYLCKTKKLQGRAVLHIQPLTQRNTAHLQNHRLTLWVYKGWFYFLPGVGAVQCALLALLLSTGINKCLRGKGQIPELCKWKMEITKRCKWTCCDWCLVALPTP